VPDTNAIHPSLSRSDSGDYTPIASPVGESTPVEAFEY
jgi:hypothetical protein